MYAIMSIYSIVISQANSVPLTTTNSLIHQSASIQEQSNFIVSTMSPLVKQDESLTTTPLNCDLMFGPCTYGNYDSNCNCIPIPMCFTITGLCDNTYGNCSCFLLGMSRPDPEIQVTTTQILVATTPVSVIRKCGKRK